MANEPGLHGRKVVIVGASDVAAAAIAVALAEAGADVGLTTATDNAEEALLLKRLALRLADMGRKSVAESIDLGNITAVQQALRRISATLGGIDVLFVSTDTMQEKPTERLNELDWSLLVNRNLGSILFACQAGLREMAARLPGLPKGRVIVLVHEPSDHGMAAYMALRHAVDGLVPALAWEWNQAPVTVNGIGIPAGASNTAVTDRALWLVSANAENVSGQVSWL
ncbi:MAG TPA: SDR family NAD(P)-dependent oxidoreductase [Dehalococcoidia bacterium]|nr:SDR family NAD(P)-dependent oxidoreductase [Dehalococcoidia bacterium]